MVKTKAYRGFMIGPTREYACAIYVKKSSGDFTMMALEDATRGPALIDFFFSRKSWFMGMQAFAPVASDGIPWEIHRIHNAIARQIAYKAFRREGA